MRSAHCAPITAPFIGRSIRIARLPESSGHAIDLDTRQKTVVRYLENRAQTMIREHAGLPTPRFEVFDPTRDANIERRIEDLSSDVEFVVVDTPGRDDPFALRAAGRADTLVTPINDGFIDLDLIGQVDPDTYKIKKPSFYAEVVWDARKARAKADGGTVDWVVLRNRLQHLEAKNMRRVGTAEIVEAHRRQGQRGARRAAAGRRPRLRSSVRAIRALRAPLTTAREGDKGDSCAGESGCSGDAA